MRLGAPDSESSEGGSPERLRRPRRLPSGLALSDFLGLHQLDRDRAPASRPGGRHRRADRALAGRPTRSSATSRIVNMPSRRNRPLSEGRCNASAWPGRSSPSPTCRARRAWGAWGRVVRCIGCNSPASRTTTPARGCACARSTRTPRATEHCNPALALHRAPPDRRASTPARPASPRPRTGRRLPAPTW